MALIEVEHLQKSFRVPELGRALERALVANDQS